MLFIYRNRFDWIKALKTLINSNTKISWYNRNRFDHTILITKTIRMNCHRRNRFDRKDNIDNINTGMNFCQWNRFNGTKITINTMRTTTLTMIISIEIASIERTKITNKTTSTTAIYIDFFVDLALIEWKERREREKKRKMKEK